MAKFIDLTGKRFGKLTVLRREKNYYTPISKPVTTWLCKCDCGNEVVVFGSNLRAGNTTSCGCSHKQKPPKAEPKHDTPPAQPGIEDTLIIGEVYTIKGKRLKCIGLYNGFARFEDEHGFTTGNCYHYGDLERMLK